MTNYDWGDFSYIVLPGNCMNKNFLKSHHNKAYGHWRKIWSRVLERLNGKNTFKADDIMKYDQISSIFYKDEVVAQICSRTLNLNYDLTKDIPYFSDFLGDGEKILENRNVKKLLTLEYNALNSKFSLRKSNFPFTESVLYLCYKLAKSLDVGCCTAVPRKITKVQDMLEGMNFINVKKDESRYNCPVDIMLGFTDDLKEPAGATKEFVNRLWENRLDYNQFENIERKNNLYPEKDQYFAGDVYA